MSDEPHEVDGSGYSCTGGPQPWPTITFETVGRNTYMETDGRTYERLGEDWVETTNGDLAYVVPKFRIDPSALTITWDPKAFGGSTP